MLIRINGQDISFQEDENKSLMTFLKENGITIKSNCDGNGACGTCHIKLDEEHYDKLDITDHEQDILEKQMNLTVTSRLSCQVFMTKELDGADIVIL